MANIKLQLQKNEYGDEFRVAVFVNGKFSEGETYYTDDKEDCKGTQKLIANRYSEHGHSVQSCKSFKTEDF